MLNVLVVSGGSFQGSTVIKGLSQSKEIRITLVDCYGENINKYNVESFYRIPPIKEEGNFIESLSDVVKLEGIQVIFPSTDHELDTLSKYKDFLERDGSRVAISDYPLLSKLRNKRKADYFLAQHNFPVLRAVDIERDTIDLPLIGKPVYGFGSKNQIVLRERKQLQGHKISELKEKYFWQPYISHFVEYSIDFAIGFNMEVSPPIARRRIRSAGGFAVITQSEHDEIILAGVLRLAHLLSKEGGEGIFNVQVLRVSPSDFYYTDINPRVGTSSIFTLGLGINLPLFMCRYFNPEIFTIPYSDISHISVKMIRNLDERWIKPCEAGAVKGIVFDLDDTLINQKGWMFEKLELVWEMYKHQLPDKEAFLIAAYGFLEEGKRSILIDELISFFRLPVNLRDTLIQAYRTAEPESISVYRDVKPSLRELREMGFRLAVLTDNPVVSQQQKLNKLDFLDIFDAIVFSRARNREKPDSEIFNEVAQELDVPNHQLVMVGDNLYRDTYGCLSAGYSFAFHIAREGTFYNFDFNKFLEITKLPPEKIAVIKSLKELVYSLVM